MHVLILGASNDTLQWSDGPAIQYDRIICADGGLSLAKKWSLTPDLVVGDGDSYGREFPKDIPREVYSCEKDETDSELAISKAIEIGATHITLTGFLGGRLDHTLVNIYYVSSLNIQTRFLEQWGEVYFADNSTEVIGNIGDRISLIPMFTDVEGVETKGLKYPLFNETLLRNKTRGISNELVCNKALIKKQHGQLLIVHFKTSRRDS